MTDIHIEIKHPDDAHADKFKFNVDTGVLALPKHIKIGGKTWDGQRINDYREQVWEYEVWLSDQIKLQNEEVMIAMDQIYGQALTEGIVLTTVCMPQPWNTHAHSLRAAIIELATGGNDEGNTEQ